MKEKATELAECTKSHKLDVVPPLLCYCPSIVQTARYSTMDNEEQYILHGIDMLNFSIPKTNDIHDVQTQINYHLSIDDSRLALLGMRNKLCTTLLPFLQEKEQFKLHLVFRGIKSTCLIVHDKIKKSKIVLEFNAKPFVMNHTFSFLRSDEIAQQRRVCKSWKDVITCNKMVHLSIRMFPSWKCDRYQMWMKFATRQAMRKNIVLILPRTCFNIQNSKY